MNERRMKSILRFWHQHTCTICATVNLGLALAASPAGMATEPDQQSPQWKAGETDTEGYAKPHGEDQDAEQISRSLFGLRAAPIDEPLITDRPDFTESTETVPFGRFQIEVGYTFTYDREGSDRRRNQTFPEALLRVGIVENFELRFAWLGYSITELNYERKNENGRTVSEETWEQGAEDLDLGFKLKIADQKDLLPNLALLGNLSVPTGSPSVSPGDVEPSLGLLWSYELTERLGIAGQFILAVPTDAGDRFVQAAASVSLAAALTDRLGGYLEYFGFYPNTEQTDCAHSVNGGLTYLITPNFQVDIRAGFGLNEEADDFFTGAGFAWRF